jgi:hypothetical protein
MAVRMRQEQGVWSKVCALAAIVASLMYLLTGTVIAQPMGGGFSSWVTIGHPGNAPYMGTPTGGGGGTSTIGRGRVDTVYHIQQSPFTLSEWAAYANAINQNDQYPIVMASLRNRVQLTQRGGTPLGAYQDLTYVGPGARILVAPGWENVAAPLSWREGALIANWLHNGRQNDPTTILTGAYDTSTWGNGPNMTFTDGDRLPGARFWIPSLDEWIKAAHYDANRYGPEQGGYWLNPWRDGDPLRLPINGMLGLGLDADNDAEWTDTAERLQSGAAGARYVDGFGDIRAVAGYVPSLGLQTGSSPTLRLATNIPTSGTFTIFALTGSIMCLRIRRLV